MCVKLKGKILCILIGLFPLAIIPQAVPEKVETKATEGKVTESKLVPLTDPGLAWNLAFYGFVKADYIYASKAVLSYGREQLQAANQAKRQVQRDDYQRRDNIQLQDTRLGFRSKYGSKLTGVIELDFIDFNQSSPNVNVRPRLRQAYVEWNITPEFQFFGGQKWDIFSPLNPDTYNIINSLFYNGNLGWMREQFGLAYQVIPDLKATIAIGNSGVNVNPNPSVVERNPSPTVAAQLKWTPNKENTVYLSGIVVDKRYYDLDDPSVSANKSLFYNGGAETFPSSGRIGKSAVIKRNAVGVSLGSEYKPESGKFRLKWEANWGRNVGDLNTLGISQAQMSKADNFFAYSTLGVFSQSRVDGLLNSTNSAGLRAYNKTLTEVRSIEEMGGWISMGYQFHPKWELISFIGGTKIVNQKDLSPAVDDKGNIRDLTISQPDVPIWTATQLGRMRESVNGGYSFTYLAEVGLKLFFQHEYIQTFYKDAERNQGIFAHIKSIDLDTGMVTLQDVTPSYMKASAKATAHLIRFGTMYNF